MPARKDRGTGALDAELRVRLPAELKAAALRKAAALEYPTDLSAVVRVLLRRWVAGRTVRGRYKRRE